MRSLTKHTLAAVGAALLALSSLACNESDTVRPDDVEKTDSKLTKCHDYENYAGDSCSICFNYHYEWSPSGRRYSILDDYSDFCD